MDLNSVCLIGRLGRDADLKYTSAGQSLASFSIAVECGWGEKKKTGWFSCTLWGKRAESLAQYLTKGTRVAVAGSLRQDTWEKEGEKRERVVINVSDVQLLGGGKRADGDAAGPAEDSGAEGGDSF